MKKYLTILLGSLSLLLSACVFVPATGMLEKTWLRHTISADLVYIDGNVKAYRSDGSYYYFRDGKLAKVVPELLTPDKV